MKAEKDEETARELDYLKVLLQSKYFLLSITPTLLEATEKCPSSGQSC